MRLYTKHDKLKLITLIQKTNDQKGWTLLQPPYCSMNCPAVFYTVETRCTQNTTQTITKKLQITHLIECEF